MKYKIKRKLYSGFSFVTTEYSRNIQYNKIIDLPFKNIQHYNTLLKKILLCYSHNKIDFEEIFNVLLINTELCKKHGKIKLYQKVIEDEFPHVCYAKIFWRSKTDKVLFLLQQG
jgi:hypothetical protein